MYRCPVCHNPLHVDLSGYTCLNKHHFDRAKDGHLHLLSTHHHKDRGDNRELIQARHRFLKASHYQHIEQHLISILSRYPFESLLDGGCGEGFYTHSIAEHFSTAKLIGMDLSKEGLKIAAKESPSVQFINASLADIPLMDHSVDGMVSLFTPIYEKEFARILKPNGFLVIGQPNANHLIELKQALYPQVILNTPKTLEHDFKLIERVEVRTRLNLSHSALADLIDMTPYAYTSNPVALQTVKAMDTLTISVDVILDVYQPLNS